MHLVQLWHTHTLTHTDTNTHTQHKIPLARHLLLHTALSRAAQTIKCTYANVHTRTCLITLVPLVLGLLSFVEFLGVNGWGLLRLRACV